MHIYFYSNTPMYKEFSNTFYSSFILDGLMWKSVEHYYQAHKSESVAFQNIVRTARTPFMAMQLGKQIELRKDWDKVKDEIMFKALYAKFNQNPKLARLLLSTGDAELHEKSTHPYWGKGRDMLGKMLMRVREQLANKVVLNNQP